MKAFLICVFLFLPLAASAQGGKQRYAEGSDQVIDEVNQLCNQLGVESGVIEVSTCPPPDSEETRDCVVTIVDCSLAEDEE